MNLIPEIKSLLAQALANPLINRKEIVKTIQSKIWNNNTYIDIKMNEFLTELAHDLDFYEPNEEWRKEDHAYYGEDRLNELIKEGLEKFNILSQ
jgi:hypothetical protein